MNVTLNISRPNSDPLRHITLTVRYGDKETQVLFDVEAPQLDPEALDAAILEEFRLVQAAIQAVEPERLPLRKARPHQA